MAKEENVAGAVGYGIRFDDDPADGPWCAQITGLDPKYGLARDFLPGTYYDLYPDRIYEIRESSEERYFCRVVEGTGGEKGLERLTRDAVLGMFSGEPGGDGGDGGPKVVTRVTGVGRKPDTPEGWRKVVDHYDEKTRAITVVMLLESTLAIDDPAERLRAVYRELRDGGMEHPEITGRVLYSTDARDAAPELDFPMRVRAKFMKEVETAGAGS